MSAVATGSLSADKIVSSELQFNLLYNVHVLMYDIHVHIHVHTCTHPCIHVNVLCVCYLTNLQCVYNYIVLYIHMLVFISCMYT